MSQECKGEWSRAFIYKNLPNSFVVTELRDHQKDVLYQSQLALMPETQLRIEEWNRRDDVRIEIYKLTRLNNDIAIGARKLEEVRLKSWNNESSGLLGQLRYDMENKWSNRCNNILTELSENIPTRLSQMVRKNVDELLSQHTEYIANSNRLAELRTELNGVSSHKKERVQFIRKCGDAECRGFLSSRWKCGLCEKSTCSDCHEFLLDKEHVCNPDNIATAQLLAADTKACPKCQTNIYKIDGCDQMWCTQCHTGFSWKTGKIELKMHNPHYYEWQRQNGGLARAAGDVQCGRVMDHFLAGDIRRAIRDRITELDNEIEDEDELSEITTNLEDGFLTAERIIRNCVQLIAYERNELDIPGQNLQLRIRYLLHNMDEKEFKKNLLMLETKYAKELEIRTITQLLTTTVTDIMYRFKVQLKMSVLAEVDAIVEYVNNCLVETGKVFKMASIIQFEKDISINRIMKPK